jgi:hypothetical protein
MAGWRVAGADLAAQRRRGRLRPATEAGFAALSLPCAPRGRGPAQNSLRSLRSLRSDNCAESVNEARFARAPDHCGARRLPRRPQAPWTPPSRYRAARQLSNATACVAGVATAHVSCGERQTLPLERWAVPGWGAVGSGEKRRTRAGARSALRHLTRRNCLSAVSAANEASFAAQPWFEHRSGVGAQRRPLPSAPHLGTARRDARCTARWDALRDVRHLAQAQAPHTG